MSPSEYETSNIYLASFLRCQGMTFLGFKRASERRVLFRFASEPKLHVLLRLYWSGAPVELVPFGLFGALRNFKRLVRRRPNAAAPAPKLPAATDSPNSHAEH